MSKNTTSKTHLFDLLTYAIIIIHYPTHQHKNKKIKTETKRNKNRNRKCKEKKNQNLVKKIQIIK